MLPGERDREGWQAAPARPAERRRGRRQRRAAPCPPARPHAVRTPPPVPPQGWIGFVETCAPEIIPHISSCKSPHMMVGSVLKTYFAEARRGCWVRVLGWVHAGLGGGCRSARAAACCPGAPRRSPVPVPARPPPRPPPSCPAAEDWQAVARGVRGQRDAVRAQAGRGGSYDVPHARWARQVRGAAALGRGLGGGGHSWCRRLQMRGQPAWHATRHTALPASPQQPCLHHTTPHHTWDLTLLTQTSPEGREVDHVITTKDLAAMCKEAGIDFASLPGTGGTGARAGAGDGREALVGPPAPHQRSMSTPPSPHSPTHTHPPYPQTRNLMSSWASAPAPPPCLAPPAASWRRR